MRLSRIFIHYQTGFPLQQHGTGSKVMGGSAVFRTGDAEAVIPRGGEEEVKKKRSRLRCGLPLLTDDEFPFGGKTPGKPQPSFVEMFDPALFDQQVEMTPAHDPGSTLRQEDISAGPEREIDLHGLTVPEAELKVKNFLITSRQLGVRAVRVITGKGIHSPGLPVLPEMMERLAREMKNGGEIRNFAWEKGRREKSGAMLISL